MDYTRLTRNALNEVARYYGCNESFSMGDKTRRQSMGNLTSLNESEGQEELLHRAISLYDQADTEDIDFSMEDDTIELTLFDNTENNCLIVNVNIDYEVTEFSQTQDSYDSPGYIDFDSRIEGLDVTIYDDETGEQQHYADGDGRLFADRIAKDYKDRIDDMYIENEQDDDGYDPDYLNDIRFDR